MKNDTPITITLTRIDLCNLALACTNAWAQSNADKWVRLHDTIIAEIVAADEADQEAQESPQEAPTAEAEQQPTETENAPQAATQAAEEATSEKEAETMTTTEREALERINARQNAANLFTNITHADIAAELAAMEAEQAAPAPDPDAVTLAPADAAQVWTEEGKTVATATEAATVAGIIRRQGGYRERIILLAPHEMTHGETWNAAHKVVYVTETTPGPDGYCAGCAVDIVTRSIVG